MYIIITFIEMFDSRKLMVNLKIFYIVRKFTQYSTVEI